MTEPQLDAVGRPEPPNAGSELATLLGFLDYQRATLEWKTRGLDDEKLRRPLAPSTMTLAGLLEHLARVEDGWFARTVAGRPMPEPWASHDDPAWPWSDALTRSGAELRALWASRVAASNVLVGRLIAADADALDRTHPARGGEQVSLRWVLVHMLEEYARHNGHADLLREAIDGATGE
jgi:uncharacterized damage-inducible protein DinB